MRRRRLEGRLRRELRSRPDESRGTVHLDPPQAAAGRGALFRKTFADALRRMTNLDLSTRRDARQRWWNGSKSSPDTGNDADAAFLNRR